MGVPITNDQKQLKADVEKVSRPKPDQEGPMKRFKTLFISSALMLAMTGFAAAQDRDHDRDKDRDKDNRNRVVQQRTDRDGDHDRARDNRQREEWRERQQAEAREDARERDRREDARERAEWQRTHNNGYYNNGYYNNGYRTYPNSTYYPNNGYYGYNNGAYGNSPGFNLGFNTGLADGRNARFSGNGRYGSAYNKSDRGYNSSFGDKNVYRQQYQLGYQQGFQQGMSGR